MNHPTPLHVLPAKPNPQAAFVGRRVLVVDDDDLARMALTRMLQREGATVESFADGVSAVAWCATHHGAVVDALIIDLRMPVMSGVEARRALMEALGPQAPAGIGISAAVQDSQGTEERRDALDAGFDAFLPKPVDWPALRHALERLFVAADAARQPAAPDAPAPSPSASRRELSGLLAQGLTSLQAGDDIALPELNPAADPQPAAEAAVLRLLRQARQRGTPAAKSPDGICRLVYRSQGRLSGPQALALLMQCQGNNARNGVTGMLIHDGDRFIQVLEAAPATIDSLFARILRDTRHHAVEVVELAIDQPRLFGAWSMGSLNLDPRHFELLLGHLQRRADPPAGSAADTALAPPAKSRTAAA